MTPDLHFLLLLRDLAYRTEQESFMTFLFLHPVLLDRQAQQGIADTLEGVEGVDRIAMSSALQAVRSISEHMESGSFLYPIGSGPIEAIEGRRASGEIDEKAAGERVRSQKFLWTLSPHYLESLAAVCQRMLFSGEGAKALALLTLAIEVVPHLDEESRWRKARADVTLEYIQCAAYALGQIPDGRIFKRALKAGEELIAWAKKAKDREVLAEAHRRVGVLHLDPFTARRTNLNFQSLEQAWRYRIVDHLGAAEYARLSKEVSLPSTEKALDTAAKHLREAVKLTAGRMRGLNLKALVQAIFFKAVAEEKPHKDEKKLRELIDEALPLLDREVDEVTYLELLAWRQNLEAVEPAPTEDAPLRPIDELVEKHGPLEAMNYIFSAALGSSDFDGALRYLEDARDLFMSSTDDQLRTQRWVAMQQVARKLFGVEADPRGWKELEASIRRVATPQTLPWGLYFLAFASGSWDAEIAGLACLDEIEKADPDFASRNGDAIAYARGTNHIGIANNEIRANKPAAAIEAYGRAVHDLLTIRQSSMVADMIRRIYDLLEKHGADDEDVGVSVIRALFPSTVMLEVQDERITSQLRRLYRDTVAAMAQHHLNPVALLLLFEMAKGLRFASALRGGFDRDAVARLTSDDRLRAIRELERKVSATGPVSIDAHDLLYEYLLASYVSPDEQQSGVTDRQRLENLQLAFDHDLSRAVLSSVNAQDVYIAPEQIQKRLDPGSVVIIQFLGATAEGQLGLFLAAMTHDTMRFDVVTHPFPEATVSMEFEGREFRMHPFGLLVQSLREKIVRTPDYRVDSEAAETLEKDRLAMFGHVAEFLDDLRAKGYDRMYVAPHGPLHFYPFHLIGKVPNPLAAHWTISYLPNIHLVSRDQPSAAVAKEPIAAIGIGFDDELTKNLGDAMNSREEASEIASLFGAKPMIDGGATQARVVPAIQSARHVHISTHGRHNVTAPAFQYVQLYPDGDDDGRLFAHEIAALDLSGVDLVTLSACETALGRFDEADNLRGLPASLLLAGARAIVGTLWPVEQVVARLFFTTLYRAIHSGSDATKAFRAAQLEAMQRRPDYRDWGAFYLVAGVPAR